MEREFRQMLLSRGADLVAYADLRCLPAGVRDGLPVGVLIARGLDRGIVDEILSGPTEEYGAEYVRVNALLGELSRAGADFLQAAGHSAVARPATLSPLPEGLATPLPHKTIATLAGIGWIGKMALLVTERFGSAFRMSSILTDAPLPSGKPVTESRCGDCRACVTTCPAGASAGRNWQPGMRRENLYDAFACRRMIGELARKRGLRTPVCGMCVSVCPWTRRYVERNSPGDP